MNWVSPEADDEGSGSQAEPPDPNIRETDPTWRYICYNEVLGKGAFKTAYKGFDEVDGIEVAWNQVRIDDVLQSAEDLDRLQSEVNILKSLKHENIVKFLVSWIDDSNKTVNIITELFTSGNLRQYRKKHKKVDMKVLKGWARQILTGLDYLHSRNPPIIHRDLKCDNIFINGNRGQVKIGDLGLAIVMQHPNARSVIGTPEFMAPELYDEDYNELVDIYSFGMCMLEMVTFEYPYSECTNSAQIFKKVSSGIKPTALSKVKDPDIKAFIEKCLVPAAQRLSARELLKDPFLQVDALNCNQVTHSLPSPNITLPRTESLTDGCVLSEGQRANRHEMVRSMDNDVDDGEPLVVNVVENSNSNGSQFLTLDIQKKTKKSVFRLEGKRDDVNSVSLILHIADHGRIRNIQFSFYLDSDTALSVASEMAVQLELAEVDIKFIAQLIDSLLINLIPGWEPCISIDQLVTLDSTRILKDENKNIQLAGCRKSSVGSFHNVSEAPNECGSHPCIDCCFTEVSIQPIEDAAVYDKADHVMVHADSMNVVVSDGQGSSDRDDKSPGSCMHSQSGHNYYGFKKQNEFQEMLSGVENIMHLGQKEIEANNIVDSPEFPCYSSHSSSSFLSDENEDNEELRLELEMIEFQYQQALDDISRKKQEAIAMAKRKAAQKKQRLV